MRIGNCLQLPEIRHVDVPRFRIRIIRVQKDREGCYGHDGDGEQCQQPCFLVGFHVIFSLTVPELDAWGGAS